MNELIKNKLYTLSYFRKRLHDNKIPTNILLKYDNEIRYWTILVYPNKEKLLITCYKNNSEYWFTFYYKDITTKIITKSMEVIINQIKDLIPINSYSNSISTSGEILENKII